MAFRLAARAHADLDEIWDYMLIESGSEEIADRVLDLIADRFDILADWPQAGRSRDELRRGYRSFAAGDYLILYRIVGNDVAIQRIIHGRRDLGRALRGR